MVDIITDNRFLVLVRERQLIVKQKSTLGMTVLMYAKSKSDVSCLECFVEKDSEDI